MRKLILLIILFCLILAFNAYADSDYVLDPGWELYYNEHFGFIYPAEWTIYSEETENSDEISLVRFDVKEGYLFGIVMSESEEFSSISCKCDFYTHMENELLSDTYENVIINDYRRTTIDSLPAYRIIYTVNDPKKGEKYKALNTFVYYQPGQIFIIVANTPEEEFDEELFNKIIDSIEIYR
ncbi:MAG: PsbP-related protein [Halanaerobiales bacterium]